MASGINTSEQIYSFLLKLYPKSYRERFEEEMKYVFSQSLKDSYRENGENGVIKIWARVVLDTGKSLLREHLDNIKGGESMKKNRDILMQNKAFAYLAIITAVILSLPYLAMKFQWVRPDPSNPNDRGVDWALGDFVLMGALIFGMGSLFIYLARVTPRKYRIFVALGILAVFLLIWAHLAVGLVDSWPLAGS